MNLQELTKKMSDIERRRVMAATDITVFTKTILPVLKDHQLNNLALELEAKLFTYDNILSEINSFIESSKDSIIQAIRDEYRGSQE